MKKIIITTLVIFSFITAFAKDNGVESTTSKAICQIDGKIIDKTTGEGLAGVAIEIEGIQKKYYTDFNGNFLISNVNPGVYNIKVNYLSYQKLMLKEISTTEVNTKLKVELENIAMQ